MPDVSMPLHGAPGRALHKATITLLCQAGGPLLEVLPREPGQGPTVLCAPQSAAVATAQRLFPDRHIEVKTLYGEPALGSPGLPRSLALLRWMLAPPKGAESAEEVRRRVVDTAVRLVGGTKSQDEALLVAGPALLRLLAFKLNAIGFIGPLVRGFKPGRRRVYRYRV